MIFLGKLIIFWLLGQKRTEMNPKWVFFQISKINAWNFSDFLLSCVKAWNYLEQIFRKKIAFKFLGQKGPKMDPKWCFSSFLEKKYIAYLHLYIALFAVSVSIIKVFSIDCANVCFSQLIVNYLFSIFFQ